MSGTLQTITREELSGLVSASDIGGDAGVQLLDVRPDHLFQAAHVPGAESIPFDTVQAASLEDLTAKGLTADRPLVVYGRKTEAGQQAADHLVALGFADVRLFEGGMNEWLREQEVCEPPLKGWACGMCSYGYQAHRGDGSTGIEPGTLFEELPANWGCPWCGAPKDRFFKETWT